MAEDDRMNDKDDEYATKLRFEFHKNIGAMALAAFGGAITLLHTVFSGAGNKSLAYISVSCFFLSSTLAYGAQEALLNRLSPPPQFRSRLARLALTPRFRSIEAQYAFEALSAALFGVGLVLFAFFVVAAKR